MASPYRINLPVYEGPLDLLLDLIRKQEMDIHNIPIAKVTEQYLDYLHQLEKLDIDVSADFIYMAATLIHIKSKMLLPRRSAGRPGRAAGSARRTGPPFARTRKIQERRAASVPEAADRSPRLVASGPFALHRRRSAGRAGRLARRSGKNVPADSRTPQGTVPKFELHHETVTIAQMMDRLRQRLMATRRARFADRVFRSLRDAQCHDRRAAGGARNGAHAGRDSGAVGAVRGYPLRKHKMFDAVFAGPDAMSKIEEQYL